MIGDLSTDEKLDGSNYNMWHRKIQFILDEREVLELLQITMSVPATEDKMTRTLLPLRSIKLAWLRTKHGARKIVRHAILYCMHDDLIGEFENYPTAKEMWDNIHYRYGQISKTRLRALHLKWMT